MKRYINILTAVCVVAFLLLTVSCSKKEISPEKFGDDGYIVDLDANGRNTGRKLKPDYVMKVGDTEVPLSVYRYYYLNTKDEMDGGNMKHWEEHPEYISVLEENVKNSIVEIYSMRELCAQAGVESDIDAVNKRLKELKGTMSSADFKKGLEAYYLTEELYKFILENEQLYSALYEHYYGENGVDLMNDNQVLEYAKENYTHTLHIKINPNTQMSEGQYKEYLESVLVEAKNTDDFESVMEKHNDDSEIPDIGYYFTSSQKPELYVEACDSLDPGEISDLVLLSDGYYIIKKLEISSSDVSTLRNIIYYDKFDFLIENKIAAINIEYDDTYSLIAPDTLK